MLSNLAKAMPASRHLLFFVGFLLIIPMGCGGSSGGSSSPQLPGASQAPITAEVQMNQGLLAGIFLRQNSDQRYLLRAFPRGLEFAANAGAPQEVGLPVLRKLLKAESEKEAQAAQARTRSAAPPKHSAAPFSCTTTQPPSPNSGVPIGYSSTIGPKLDALCFNYTVENPPAPITQITFDSSSNASSFSSILNTSDSISGGFTALKANDNFTYSQNYQSSVNSGQVIFSAESIYTLNVILDPNNPLNPFGCQEFKDHLLGQICGDQFMSQIAAGAIIMGEFSWWSNSSTASTNVSNTLTGGDGTLVNISSAISSAQSVSDSFTKFHFEIVILGGGPTASNDLQLAVGANADSQWVYRATEQPIRLQYVYHEHEQGDGAGA